MNAENLRKRVASALVQTKKTNEFLAKRLEVNKNTIAAYKKGKGNIKGAVLVGLVKNDHNGLQNDQELSQA